MLFFVSQAAISIRLARPDDAAGVAAVHDAAWREAESTVDAVASRFGVGAIGPAALLGRAPARRIGADGDD